MPASQHPSRHARIARRVLRLTALLVALAVPVLAARATPKANRSTRAATIDAPELSERAAFRNRLATLVDVIQTYHADPAIEPQKIIQGAIDGMLETLDPHTHFLDRASYRTMRESQDGSFFGLGIIISVRRDAAGRNRLTVISPIDGGPAKRLGVRPGDIIAAIDGTSTDGLQLDQAVTKLRGTKGSTVKITIERVDESFELDVERAEIPTESVQHAYMIRPHTGFVRVKDFTKTTTPELRAAFKRLRAEGMNQLILDLRDNPGGLLDEAVTVAGLMLEPGDLVVETRGRIPGSNESHRAPGDPDHLPDDVKLIVLVNRGSASASEIVAGAIQDHDRGLIVGTTTWGKGLVQSVYTLSEDCGLALTTARYYTPSGRQIQRDYRSSFFDYYYPRPDARPEGEEHVTDGGRTVQDGGGIEPDVSAEAEKMEPLVQRLIQRSMFFRFAGQHLARHPGSVKAGAPLAAKDLAEFKDFAGAEKFELQEEDWTAALPQLTLHVQQELHNAHLGLTAGFKVIAEADAQVQRALTLWDHADPSTIVREAKSSPKPAVTAPTPG